MRRLCLLIGVGAVVLPLSACAGTGNPTQPQRDVAPPATIGINARSATSKHLETPAYNKPKRIYVADMAGSQIRSYKANGMQVSPTIDVPSAPITGLATDASGKIYVSIGSINGEILTFDSKGKPTTPTISGLEYPNGITTDAAGKIYVPLGNNVVETFLPDGTPTSPTITAGLDNPYQVAVRSDGYIFVANFYGQDITSYAPDGTQVSPTITTNINRPAGVAVDGGGDIYVANNGNSTVTVYDSGGTEINPTITKNITRPGPILVSPDGKMYVLDVTAGEVTTYTLNGKETKPTITGAELAAGLALQQ